MDSKLLIARTLRQPAQLNNFPPKIMYNTASCTTNIVRPTAGTVDYYDVSLVHQTRYSQDSRIGPPLIRPLVSPQQGRHNGISHTHRLLAVRYCETHPASLLKHRPLPPFPLSHPDWVAAYVPSAARRRASNIDYSDDDEDFYPTPRTVKVEPKTEIIGFCQYNTCWN